LFLSSDKFAPQISANQSESLRAAVWPTNQFSHETFQSSLVTLTAQPAHLASVKSGGSDGLLMTASHQGAEYCRESSSEPFSHSFFFIGALLTRGHPPKSTQAQAE
jgi:hypothetical protein